MNLSIIVVNFNTRQLLKNCLDSLRQASDSHSEVIVVDNHSSDGSAEMVRTEFPEVRVIENAENSGFAKANNQGIREARGKHLLLLNSDTIVRHGALEVMSDFLNRHPEVGGVTCRLVNADGSVQACVSRRPGALLLLLRLSGLSHLVRGDRLRRLLRLYLGWLLGATVRSYLDPYAATDAALEVENISAACLMLRREAVAEVGMLDEKFFMYFEDIDYCIRLQDAGWKLYYLPASEIVHLVGQSSGGRMRNYSTHSYRSLFYFYYKHYAASSLSVGRLIVLSLSALRWLWNLVLSWMSDSSVYVRNRQDLESIIRLCWERPLDMSNSKTLGHGRPAPGNIRETVSISGGNE